jgi:hypothetical protein
VRRSGAGDIHPSGVLPRQQRRTGDLQDVLRQCPSTLEIPSIGRLACGDEIESRIPHIDVNIAAADQPVAPIEVGDDVAPDAGLLEAGTQTCDHAAQRSLPGPRQGFEPHPVSELVPMDRTSLPGQAGQQPPTLPTTERAVVDGPTVHLDPDATRKRDPEHLPPL